MHQPGQILGFFCLDEQVKMISHQAQPINLHGQFLLGLLSTVSKTSHLSPLAIKNCRLLHLIVI